MLLLSGIVEIAGRVLRLVDALREKRDDSERFPSVGAEFLKCRGGEREFFSLFKAIIGSTECTLKI